MRRRVQTPRPVRVPPPELAPPADLVESLWAGRTMYSCPSCSFNSLDETKARLHMKHNHRVTLDAAKDSEGQKKEVIPVSAEVTREKAMKESQSAAKKENVNA